MSGDHFNRYLNTAPDRFRSRGGTEVIFTPFLLSKLTADQREPRSQKDLKVRTKTRLPISSQSSALTFIKRGRLWSVTTLILLIGVSTATLFYGSTTAATAPTLGTAQSFAVIAGETVTSTGPTSVTGDLGVWPGTAITAVPPVTLSGGVIHASDAVAMQAQGDLTTAYNALAAQACDQILTGIDLGGLTLTAGVYCFASTAQLTGALTLDAQGDPNAVFVFKIGSALTTASNSSVQVINAGQICNAYWQVGSSATLGTGTAFAGNILALASITLDTGASLSGRALARTGAVTMDSNAVAAPFCLVAAAPAIAKSFSPATIAAGGTSTLTITLSNPNTNPATLTVPLADVLPAGIVIAATPNAVTTCGGVVNAVAGENSVTLTGGAIPAGAPGTCTISVSVTAPLGGSFLNSLAAGILQTINGNNTTSALATLTVIAPGPGAPTIAKTFAPASINAGGVSTLTIVMSNPNPGAAAITASLVDTLPAGLLVAAVPNVSNTCGGTVTANAGAGSVTLTGGSIPGGAPGTCSLTVDVRATLGGGYLNTLAAGALQTGNGNNANPTFASLTVVPPPPVSPSIGKTFTPSTINAGGVSTLQITLSNPNLVGATLTAPLIDTLPVGVVVAVAPNVTNTCGGTVTAAAGSGAVTLTGGSIPAGAPGTCTINVDVTAATGGGFLNQIIAGALQTINGTNGAGALATLTVIPPGPGAPVLGKVFSPVSVTAGTVSTLTITLSNPNGTVASLSVPLVDVLPVGLVIAATPNAVTTCGGVLTAVAGQNSVTLTGGAIPGGSPGVCTVTVNVSAALGGSYQNTLPANALQTINGNNATPAIATLTVVSLPPALPPTLSKSLSPASINVGGLSTLTITLSNPNTTAASLSAPLIDTLPAGLIIAATPNASTTCPGSGAVIAVAGTGSVILPATRSIPAGVGGQAGTCVVLVNVTASLPGTYLNTLAAGALQTPNGSNIAAAISTLSVLCVAINTTISTTATVCGLSTGNVASVPDAGAGATYTWLVTNGTITSGQGTNIISWTAGTTTPITLNVTLTTTPGCSAMGTASVLVSEICSTDLSLMKTGATPVALENGQFVYTLTVTNQGPGTATGVTVNDPLTAGLIFVSATPSQGSCSGTSLVVCDLGNLVPLAQATITLIVRLPPESAGSLLVNTATVISQQFEVNPNNNISSLSVPIENIPAGPGPNLPSISDVSDQKPGSILVFPFYVSDATVPNQTNTQISITNVDSNSRACLHLFLTDGSSCSVSDVNLCLTPNQTVSFLMSDLDPGTTGHLMAVLVDCVTGCPINANTLIGDAYIKLASGQAANLGAEAIAAIPGGQSCDSNSITTELRFDGIMYNQLPRVLALDSIPSPTDGNAPILVLTRIGGDLTIGAASIGPLFGVLYSDTEESFSFTLNASCQLRSVLSDSFPRTVPRVSTVIPAGRTGWLKLWADDPSVGLFGAFLNSNPNSATSGAEFNQGRNLHKLTRTGAASVTIPVYPPSC